MDNPFGDFNSSVSSLDLFLDGFSSEITIEECLFGPGPCLLGENGENLPGYTLAQLRRILEICSFEAESVPINISIRHKIIIRLFSKQDPAFFLLLNDPFKHPSRSPELFVNVAKFSRVLIEALRELSTIPEFVYEGVAYRGLSITGDEPYKV